MMQTEPFDPYFDPASASFQANPFPTYARLRDEAPVHRSPYGFTIVSRHSDVMSVLRNSNGSRETWRYSPAYRAARQTMTERFEAWIRSQLQFLDPPDHTRQRTLLARAFRPSAIEQVRPRIREIVRDYLSGVDDAETFDLVATLARPLPNRVIIEILGLPVDEPDLVGDWATKLVRGLSTIITDDDLVAADAALQGAQEVIERSIAEHRMYPRDDLLTLMIEAEEAGDRLSTAELVGNVVMLFIAGSETTTNLIGNGMAALLEAPEQLAMLRANTDMLNAAVEEFLRFESPAQFQSRVAREPIDIDGETIEPGEMLFLALGSANRDPRRWDRPDALDIARDDLQHVAFGFGIHHCLGASLARCEAQEVFAELIDMGTITLRTETLEWGGAAALSQRGLQRLPIAVERYSKH